MRRTTATFSVAALAGGILALSMPTALAAPVPLPTDDFAGLRAAISTANGQAGADTITLNGRTTYTLTGAAGEDANVSGDLDVTSDITIVGNGATIDGAALDRLFDVRPGGALTLDDVTLTNGLAPGTENGGAIRVFDATASLVLTDGSITDSTAVGVAAPPVAGQGSGGAIVAAGSLSATGTTFSGNTASRAGGAIEVTATGSATLTDVAADTNAAGTAPGNGGVLHITGAGTADVTGGTFTDNTAVEGGALWNSPAGVLTVTDASITDNTATGALADQGGGGIFTEGGDVTVTDSLIAGNSATGAAGSGGGIQNINGTLTVTDSEVSDNTALRAGGGIEAGPLLPVGDPAPPALPTSTVLDNVTLSGNSLPANPATRNGGGLHITGAGTVDVSNSTVTDNTSAEGGGLWNSAAATMTVTDTEISGNTADGALADQGGGGIFTEGGAVTVSNSFISENTASGTAGSGGGIQNIRGSVSVSGTAIVGNTAQRAGGGIEAGPILLNGAPDPASAATSTTLDDVALNDNTLLGAPRNGGGLHLTGAGTVEVANSEVLTNTAAEGGGLWNSAVGTMTVTNTLLDGNTADGALADQGGGAIFSEGGAVTVTGSSIIGNDATGAAGSGGGIQNIRGSLTVIDTQIVGNSANRAGGGIEAGPILLPAVGEEPPQPDPASPATSTTLSGVYLAGNDAGTAPGNGGGLHLTGAGTVAVDVSFVDGNTAQEGGGLWNSAVGTMTVTNSTIANNAANGEDSGGGLYNDGGTLSVTNATIANNTSLGLGGGVESAGPSTTTLLHVTIVDNSSGIAGPATLTNSIVARNGDAGDANIDAGSELVSNGGNVLGLNVTSTSGADVTGVADPGLGVLSDNGGPAVGAIVIPTMLPQAGSPAIDFGLNAESTPTDQRGVSRPLDGDADGSADVDAGAVEAPGTPPLPAAPPAQPVPGQPNYTG